MNSRYGYSIESPFAPKFKTTSTFDDKILKGTPDVPPIKEEEQNEGLQGNE